MTDWRGFIVAGYLISGLAGLFSMLLLFWALLVSRLHPALPFAVRGLIASACANIAFKAAAMIIQRTKAH